MIVVADSSPLSHLIRIDQVNILPRLFGQIVIPAQVLLELSHPRAPEAVRAFSSLHPHWIEVKEPLNPVPIPDLDFGEVAAINLAKQLGADLLLIDEKVGRQIASGVNWNLKITGTIGILERASAIGLVDLKECLKRLQATKFHVSEHIAREALARDAQRRS